jgi:hypothetical protein
MTDVKLPRIAYVTTYDERDLHAWSGVVHTIAGCLVSAGFELDMIGMSEPATLRTKALKGSSLFRVGGLVDLESCCDRFRWCRRAG